MGICRSGGIPMDQRICPCFKCVTRRNNAQQRSGNNRSDRKSTNTHGDGVKSNRNPKRGGRGSR